MWLYNEVLFGIVWWTNWKIHCHGPCVAGYDIVKLGGMVWPYDRITYDYAIVWPYDRIPYDYGMVWCPYSEKYDAACRVQERLIWFHLTSAFPSLCQQCCQHYSVGRKQTIRKRCTVARAQAGWDMEFCKLQYFLLLIIYKQMMKKQKRIKRQRCTVAGTPAQWEMVGVREW